MTVRVYVVEQEGRKTYRLKFQEPTTGKWVYRSSGIPIDGSRKARKEAERAAARLAAELEAGRYRPGRGVSWRDFRRRYESEVLTGLAPATAKKAAAAFAHVERLLPAVAQGPLRELTAERLSTLAGLLREKGLTPDTVQSNLAHLRAAVRWAVDTGLLAAMPVFPRVRRVRKGELKAKGRPLSGEEFDRLLMAVPKVLFPKADGLTDRQEAIVEGWRRFLQGLWLSGFRLAELLNLWWDRPDRLCVDTTGKRPFVRIPGALQKSGKDSLWPITPDFAGFLLETPQSDRRGRCFPLLSPAGRPVSVQSVVRAIARMGRTAGIVVWRHPVTGKPKYASAHDLRRSFGQRWAMQVNPQTLCLLMRHQSLATTFGYYAVKDAQQAAEAIWGQFSGDFGANFGATGPSEGQKSKDAEDVNPYWYRT